MQVCTYPDCGRRVNARGLCASHYNQQRAGQELRPVGPWGGRRTQLDPCAFDGCDRPPKARGYCQTHYARLHRHGSTDDRPKRGPRKHSICTFDGCIAPHMARGWCAAHYRQSRSGRPMVPLRVVRGRQVNQYGYVLVRRPDHPNANGKGWLAEHRLVMADHLGRPLAPGEEVHHRNGDRGDNRIENLELWSTSQPKGQRVADKVEWARELLALYGDEIEQHPRELGVT